jgi:hypothetical protein
VCMGIQGRSDVRHHISSPLNETEMIATLYLSILLACSVETRSKITALI